MDPPWFPDEFDKDAHQRRAGAHIDAVLTALANLQHGTATAAQLLALGISRSQIRDRVRSGHLTRIGAGVYLVGRVTATVSARRMAAVLVAGRGALLADVCAAGHLGATLPVQARVHLIVPPGRRVRRPGIDSRDALVLDHERTIVDGIPCLTWPRILLDVSARRGRRTLEDLWHESLYRKRLHMPALRRVVQDHFGEPGVTDLRALLDRRERAIGDVANRLEAEMRELIVEAGMPEPRSNRPLWIDGVRLRPDLYVPERRLAFETDGRDAHEDPEQQLDDEARDALYRSVGITSARYGWWAVQYERPRLLAELLRYEEAWQRTGGVWTPADPAPVLVLSRRSTRGVVRPRAA